MTSASNSWVNSVPGLAQGTSILVLPGIFSGTVTRETAAYRYAWLRRELRCLLCASSASSAPVWLPQKGQHQAAPRGAGSTPRGATANGVPTSRGEAFSDVDRNNPSGLIRDLTIR